jgi:hypothetical protein
LCAGSGENLRQREIVRGHDLLRESRVTLLLAGLRRGCRRLVSAGGMRRDVRRVTPRDPSGGFDIGGQMLAVDRAIEVEVRMRLERHVAGWTRPGGPERHDGEDERCSCELSRTAPGRQHCSSSMTRDGIRGCAEQHSAGRGRAIPAACSLLNTWFRPPGTRLQCSRSFAASCQTKWSNRVDSGSHTRFEQSAVDHSWILRAPARQHP